MIAWGRTTLLREDTSLVTDQRVRTLYPPWEYAGPQATARSARDTDQTVQRENLARQVAQIAAMLRGGGVVLTGTDSPIANTAVSKHPPEPARDGEVRPHAVRRADHCDAGAG